jgi:IS605 OrfB family transposase
MFRTASIRLDPTPEQAAALDALRRAYVDACNLLVPVVREHRLWNRVALHRRAYAWLRKSSPLGSQMCCNAIFSVCKAYKAQKSLGRIRKDAPVPEIRFNRGSVHFDKRTYGLKGEAISLNTLSGRIAIPMRLGDHQRRTLESGTTKEAELVFRKGRWYFNLVVESSEVDPIASGEVMGVDVGEMNLAAVSTGKVFGGGRLRNMRDRCLALRRRLQSNGSRSAKQKLRQVSGKEARRVRHINHETSKAIVEEANRIGAAKIVMEDLAHIRDRIQAGKRTRARLHRWAFRQLQSFVEYKAKAAGIAVEYVNPAYTSQTCSSCGGLGSRIRHRFVCGHCGLRAHSDLNASRNLARMGETAVTPRVPVNPPDVPEDGHLSSENNQSLRLQSQVVYRDVARDHAGQLGRRVGSVEERDYNPKKGSGGLRSACGVRFRRPFLGACDVWHIGRTAARKAGLRAPNLCLGYRPVEESVGFDRLRDREVRHPGLHPRPTVGQVHLQNPVQPQHP